MERATLRVTGVVQSVGFRPFVYRRAVTNDLRGTVRNLGDAGVRIELEGPSEAIDAFLADLREEPPPLARVETVAVERDPDAVSTFEAFDIADSEGGDGGGGTIPPDTAICGNCLADVRNPASRYYGYWATSCVDCGPRFTVIESLPYDRPATSMAAFPMCEDCREAYEDPADRRYHAQTIACPQCGPRLKYGTVPPEAGGSDRRRTDAGSPETGRDPFPDALTDTADGADALADAAAALDDGGIVVAKGIGGAHLACDATDPAAIDTLRERTGRPEKPFAVMAPDREWATRLADLSPTEREALDSPGRPIVLLEPTDTGGESRNAGLAPGIAPGLHTVGVMLPYSGVHYRLFDSIDVPLVMTSANRPGKPILRANGPIVDGLAGVADGFLLHDRRIVARCDDSVVRVVNGGNRYVRRSRGVVPAPVPLSDGDDVSVLAVGPELDVTAGLLKDGECYLTQYVGDVDDIGTFASFEWAIERLLSVTGIERPSVVAHDRHPRFNTTDYARRLVERGDADRAVAVQHHHAHAASVLAEHDRERAIALTLDGAGYGPDRTVWGGEVLDATRTDSERVGGLAPAPMPGGDRATRHPSRLVAGLLHAADPDTVIPRLGRNGVGFPDGSEERDLVVQQLEADVNTPVTTSAGRFLDAVSALLGVCTERTYEGEPAMKLEAVATRGSPLTLSVPRSTTDGRPVVDTPRLFDELLDLLEDGVSRPDVAATAQDALARGLAGIAVEAARGRGLGTVALSGGVAYNEHVTRRIRDRVTGAGLTFLGNEQVPPGDGGIAYGQAATAAARLD